MTRPRMEREDSYVDRYWWTCGPSGWSVETWRGSPCKENVVVLVEDVGSLESAERICAELNHLADPVRLID